MLAHRRPILFFSISASVLVLTTLPYLLAGRAASPAHVFGGFLINPLDGNTYLAKMYQGWQGDWRFTLPYTAEPGEGAYLFIFYVFLGHLAGALGLELPLTFHVARLLGTLALLLALDHFFTTWLTGQRQQVLAFGLAALGSGLGWLAAPFGAFTSDLWVVEAYPFLSAYATPHFSLGLALLLWVLSARGRSEWLVAPAALALSIISPFGVVIALAVLGGMALWEFSPSIFSLLRLPANLPNLAAGRPFLLALLFGVPFLLYDVWIAWTDPVLTGWNAQNLTPSPLLGDLLISFSPLLPLALVGAWVVWKRQTGAERLLLVWMALGFLLLYLPFGLQRRFMMGLYIPVAGLAACGLEILAGGRRLKLSGKLLFLLVLPTNLVVLLAGWHGVQTHDRLLFLTVEEAHAFDWMANNTPPEALVLASPETGLFIPAYCGRRVIYGHPFETVRAAEEEAAALGYFLGAGTDRALLEKRGVDYVFFGERERALAGNTGLAGLQPVYSTGQVTIYAVNRLSIR